jgi:O-6-methylguanine DNA methyltransferase
MTKNMTLRTIEDYFELHSGSDEPSATFTMDYRGVTLRVQHQNEVILSIDIVVDTELPTTEQQQKLKHDIETFCDLRSNKLKIAASFTPFQSLVWQSLLSLSSTELPTSYASVAREIHREKSARAVARVLATNTFAVILPCHLVNASSGALAGYKWGLDAKERLQRAALG